MIPCTYHEVSCRVRVPGTHHGTTPLSHTAQGMRRQAVRWSYRPRWTASTILSGSKSRNPALGCEE